MADNDGVAVHPSVLNTFAVNVGDSTNEFEHVANDQSPGLRLTLTAGRSGLAEGLEFHERNANLSGQFLAFCLDALAGVGALAYGANVIAINLVATDGVNAASLLRQQLGQVDPKDFVFIVDTGGLGGPTRIGARDVSRVFDNPASPDLGVANAHEFATSPLAPQEKPRRPKGAPVDESTALKAARDAFARSGPDTDQEPAKKDRKGDAIPESRMEESGKSRGQTGTELRRELQDLLPKPKPPKPKPEPEPEPEEKVLAPAWPEQYHRDPTTLV